MSWRVWMAVLAVALANVIFGLWTFAPVAPPPSATVGRPAANAPVVYPPRAPAPQQDAPPVPDLAEAAPPPAPKKPDAAPPGCNVAACEAAYRSFRAEDCTYQPTRGERRRCTKR